MASARCSFFCWRLVCHLLLLFHCLTLVGLYVSVQIARRYRDDATRTLLLSQFGLSPAKATHQDVHRAYRRLMRELHPDKRRRDLSAQDAALLNRATLDLGNKRDLLLALLPLVSPPPPPPPLEHQPAAPPPLAPPDATRVLFIAAPTQQSHRPSALLPVPVTRPADSPISPPPPPTEYALVPNFGHQLLDYLYFLFDLGRQLWPFD